MWKQKTIEKKLQEMSHRLHLTNMWVPGVGNTPAVD